MDKELRDIINGRLADRDWWSPALGEKLLRQAKILVNKGFEPDEAVRFLGNTIKLVYHHVRQDVDKDFARKAQAKEKRKG